MARIPDEDLERLKAEVSLRGVVEAGGITLRQAGSDLVGLCPFHDDTEPSLVVSPDKNLWHCMGACGAGGSVIDWVMRSEGVSFRHAVDLLRADMTLRGDMAALSPGPAPKRSTTPKLASPLDPDAGDDELLSQVASFYHHTLTDSPEALAYLKRRRIADPEALESFGLGYANRTLGYRLPAKNRKAGAAIRSRLQALGVLRSSGHEHLAGSVVIPVTDQAGAVTELYGRKIRDDLRPGTPAHLYLPGPHRGVWNAEGLAGGEVIVCESLIDALSFWCAGFRHVTSAYGTEGFGHEHTEALRARGVARVLIAYDRDPPGDKAAAALAAQLMAEGTECFRVEFPPGADANDVAVEGASPRDALGRFIRAATWMGAGPGPATRRQAALVQAPAPATEEPRGEPASEAPPSAAHPPLATPVPPTPPQGPVAEVVGEELRMTLGQRRWRVRGLAKVSSFDLLRVNVMVARDDERRGRVFHVDTLDLYSARARGNFVKAAAEELDLAEDVMKRDLGRVLLACEERAEDAVAAAQAPAEAAVVLSASEEAAAMDLLQDPQLTGRIGADFARAGMVGESTNALVAYLAAISRKLANPLAVIVQSSSAAGKSALMDAVLSFVPDEERVAFSAMTGQSLFYMGQSDLAHKVLAIAEEQGAERAAYALKLLQSEGELSIASTGKDAATGRLVTHTYKVQGPVAIFLTTTAIDVDEELANRCLVLCVDEDRAQTKAIHARQRQAQTLDGLMADAEAEAVLKVHRDAQRLLAPLAVVNPYAHQLGFAHGATRTRRDHMKYLGLIQAIALLHQHQRPKKSTTHAGQTITYVEATPADIALANRLATEVLGRSLDELPPGTRRLLDIIHAWVEKRAGEEAMACDQVRFTRRQLRAHTGWGDTALKVHLARLVDLELVVAHRGARAGGYLYELAWDGAGEQGERFLTGLVDPKTLTDYHYDQDRSGPNGARSGAGHPPVTPRSGGGQGGAEDPKAQASGAGGPPGGAAQPNATAPGHKARRSHVVEGAS